MLGKIQYLEYHKKVRGIMKLGTGAELEKVVKAHESLGRIKSSFHVRQKKGLSFLMEFVPLSGNAACSQTSPNLIAK